MPPALNVEAGQSPLSKLDQEELNRRIRNFFDRYACIYDSYHWYFHNVYLQRQWWGEIAEIRRRIGGPRPSVLDLGAGTGNLAIKFLSNSFEVVAVDISREMLQILRKKALRVPYGVLRLVTSDLRKFVETTPRTFDVISECSVLHHLVDYESMARAMLRKIRPGGVLYLSRVPVPPQELQTLGPARSAASAGLDRLYRWMFVKMSEARFFTHMVTPPDQSDISAQFYEHGVSLERIRKIAAEEGFREVRFRRYNERETGFLTYLDNELFRAFRRERFRETFYSVIFQREPARELA
jgi:ubiquinone/menaquinone biosynthesis C-methylase UbiE